MLNPNYFQLFWYESVRSGLWEVVRNIIHRAAGLCTWLLYFKDNRQLFVRKQASGWWTTKKYYLLILQCASMLRILETQFVVEKRALMGLNSCTFVVIKSLFLTKFFPQNHKDAINTTTTNTKYKVHRTTVPAFSLHGRKFFNITLCSWTWTLKRCASTLGSWEAVRIPMTDAVPKVVSWLPWETGKIVLNRSPHGNFEVSD